MKTLFYSSILAAFTCVSISPIQACGPSLGLDETRYSLFRNGLNNYDGLQAFYYTEYFMNSNVPDPQGLDYQRNCAEWKAIVKEDKVTLADIYAFQYETDADSFVAAAVQQDYKQFRKNTFVAWLLQKSNYKYLEYFVLAKKAETTQYGSLKIDPWEIISPEVAAQRDAVINTLIKEAINAGKKSKVKILKERYAFQAFKLAYYAGAKQGDPLYEQLHQLFEKTIKGKNSVVEGWSYNFLGQMMKDNSLERTVYLLRAFDLSEEKKLAAYNSLTDDQLKQPKLLQQYPELKPAVIAIQAFRNSGRELAAIQSLYQIDPKSKYLPFLISREINKIENWIWSKDILGFDNVNDQFVYSDEDFDWNGNDYVRINQFRDWQYFQKVVQFLEQSKAQGKSDKMFISLALVHLYNIKGEHAKAKQLLAEIKPNESSKYYSQYLIEDIIVTSQTEDIMADAVKGKLAQQLNKLQVFDRGTSNLQEEAVYDTPNAEEQDDRSELFVYLSKCFEAKGDLVSAGLLMQKSNVAVDDYGFYGNCYYYGAAESAQRNEANCYNSIAYFDKHASVEDIYRLIMFKNKKNKTLFEELLVPSKWADDDMFLDLIGTKYVREEEYHKALSVFEKIKSNFWETQYYYADYLPKHSIFYLGSEAVWDTNPVTLKPALSKANILKDIVQVLDRLQLKTINKDERAKLLYQLGKAKLNMTFHGQFWMMMSYGWTYREDMNHKGGIFSYSFYPNTVLYGPNYYQAASASVSLREALKYVQSHELKAEIIMTQALLSVYAGKKFELAHSTKQQISTTKTYQNAMISCPDIF